MIYTKWFNKNFKGAQLKNTAWVYGAVVYTGKDSKLMQNAKKVPHKRSKVERKANWTIIILALVLVIITIVCSIAVGLFNEVSFLIDWLSFIVSRKISLVFHQNNYWNSCGSHICRIDNIFYSV